MQMTAKAISSRNRPTYNLTDTSETNTNHTVFVSKAKLYITRSHGTLQGFEAEQLRHQGPGHHQTGRFLSTIQMEYGHQQARL